MSKYKIGDTVWLRQDLEAGKTYYGEDGSHNSFVSSMKSMQGIPLTIAYLDEDGYHAGENSVWGFTDEMIDDDGATRAITRMVEYGVIKLLRLDPEEKYIIVLKGLALDGFGQARRVITEECAKAGIKCVVLPEQLFDTLYKAEKVEKENENV